MEWMYHVEPVDYANASTKDIEQQLNELGRHGWEAVAAIPVGGGVQSILFKKLNSKQPTAGR
jgi:hypothetical protein